MVGSVEDYLGIAQPIANTDEEWHGQQSLNRDSGLMPRPSPSERQRIFKSWPPRVVLRSDRQTFDDPFPEIEGPRFDYELIVNADVHRVYRWRRTRNKSWTCVE